MHASYVLGEEVLAIEIVVAQSILGAGPGSARRPRGGGFEIVSVSSRCRGLAATLLRFRLWDALVDVATVDAQTQMLR